MRDRPFVSGGEAPRPYSEVRAERDSLDVSEHEIRDIKRRLELLEHAAKHEEHEGKRRLLRADAEALRDQLYHLEQRRS